MAINNEKYSRLFNQLNAEQQEAVEAIEGPLMVLAGPGTGKTQVVAMRIGRILQKTQLNAYNILALTFTEAGVKALRQRLVEIVGPDGYQVAVHTFHSFARQLVDSFSYLFKLPNNFQQLTDLERYQLLETIITADQSLTTLRPARLTGYYVQSVSKAIGELKREAISPDQLIKAAHKQQAETPQQLKEQAKQLELARIYANYQQELTKRGWLDYEDLIQLATRALTKESDVRAYYQERFQYILVDEYQDTNRSQDQLVAQLASFFDQPNLCVVGDDKQAIYRFQGASVANLLTFLTSYPQTKIVSLQRNYRSSTEIVKTASALIAHNQHQLDHYRPEIKTGLTTGFSAEVPVAQEFVNDEAETVGVINQLRTWHKQGLGWEEMAVVWRRNDQVLKFWAAAESLGLPVCGKGDIKINQRPEVRQIMTVLEAVDKPQSRSRLQAAIYQLVGFAQTEPIWQLDKEIALLPWLIKSGSSELKQLGRDLSEWADLAKRGRVTEAVRLIITRLANSQRLPQGLESLEVVNALINQLDNYFLSHPTASLGDFLTYWQTLSDYNLSVSISRPSAETKGVFVSTVHGVKGLEFTAVVMAGASDNYWRVKSRSRDIKLPSQLVPIKAWQEDELAEERRLFYVGLTRAKKFLVITSSANVDDRPTIPCQFAAEIAPTVRLRHSQPTEAQITELLTAKVKPVEAKSAGQAELSYIRAKIADQPFSYTHWRNYQDCPRRYLLQNVLRISQPPTFGTVYGQAIHRALELYFRAWKSGQDKPPLSLLTKNFAQALVSLPPVADHSPESILERGQALLTNYYEQKSADWIRPVGLEYDFKPHRVTLDKVWLTGKFDRIDPLDPVARAVRVVDYKTGSKHKTLGQIMGTTKDSDGQIKDQLAFYAVLARADRHFPYRVRDWQISFVDDAGKFPDYQIKLEPKDVESMETKIKETYEEIKQAKSFPHLGPDYEHGCELCALFPE